MNRKRMYIWQLAAFLVEHKMTMSGEELAAHLNRNNFLTEYGTLAYVGTRGTYKLIEEIWKWLHDELRLEEEADKVATAFVLPSGKYAYASEG
jgi:hypothetical protein